MATQTNRSMVSEASICTQALEKLGKNGIQSLDDNSTNAQACRNSYPFIRDAVLEDAMWTFAIDRAISVTADRDAWDQMYLHAIPEDWISVFHAYCNVATTPPLESRKWKLEGDFVLAKDATVYLWGLKRITDTARFSPMFVEALVARMAAELCIPLTKDKGLYQLLIGIYRQKRAEAATRDGQQGTNETIQSNALVDARQAGAQF